MVKLLITTIFFTLVAMSSQSGQAADAAPKRLLVVTTTLGFRHSSIPTAEKVIAELADKSKTFTVEFVQQPPGKPSEPPKPKELKPEATAEKWSASAAAQQKYEQDLAAYRSAEAEWEKALQNVLTKLSPESLRNFDGVVFANTGDLPIPDRQGFLDWIKAGHAFIGIHSATDTLKDWAAYGEMVGAVFNNHKEHVGVECLDQDSEHPANRHLGATWPIVKEEIYRFRNYLPERAHGLLVLDKDPNNKSIAGHFPISWCRQYGNGRVFYTALGHREDIWDAEPKLQKRENPVETSQAFQAHILGGIQWALGVE